jgi:hypothetical protein
LLRSRESETSSSEPERSGFAGLPLQRAPTRDEEFRTRRLLAFTLFFLGRETDTGPGRITATLEVSGDEMVGSEWEQLDDWAANTELTRQ